MNRAAAVIGIALSVSLHAWLLLLPTGQPVRPPQARPIEITLRKGPAGETSPGRPPAAPAEATPVRQAAPPPPPGRETSAARQAPPPEERPAPVETRQAPPASREQPASPRAPLPPAPPPQPAEAPPADAAKPAAPPPAKRAAAPPAQGVRPAPPAAASGSGTPATTASASRQKPSGEVTPPVYLPSPRRYPPLARERGWEGTVHLQIDITAAGTVEGVRLQRSSGYRLLDRAALQEFRRARFRPATRDGEPVAISVSLPVVFELE